MDVKRQKSRDIDKQIAKEEKLRKNESVLLMLGPGGSGKSTFCKQLKILHLFGFSEAEKEKFRYVIHLNIIDAICTLLEAAFNNGVLQPSKSGEGSSSGNNDLNELGDKILRCFRGEVYRQGGFVEDDSDYTPPEELSVDGAYLKVWKNLDPQVGADFQQVWSEPKIKKIYNEQAKNGISGIIDDSAPFYLNNMAKIFTENFIPNELDILRARIKTTSVVETTFEWEGSRFRVVDVGGQRGERKKWLPLFSGVTAIIFCVGLSDYDVAMEENRSQNRMKDALDVFKQIANNPTLEKTPIILFLNKEDLFKEKLSTSDLSLCFPDYKGGANYQKAIAFIKKKFEAANPQKKLFIETTVATDTKVITSVWNSVRELTLGRVMEEVLPL